MENSRNTAILIFIALLILGAAAYLFMGQDRLTSGVAAQPGPASSAEQTFISLTSQLDPVAFDTAILSDKRFMMLQDIRTAIVPETPGRQDPFAPLTGSTFVE